MDFWATLGVIAKRWYVVVPMVLLALAGAFAVFASVPTRYESRSVILMNTPPTGSTAYANGFRPDATNPLMNSQNGLDLTGSVLIQAMRTSEFATKIGLPDDGSVTFSVNNGTDNPELLITGPFVFITAESSTSESAESIVERAVAGAREELQIRQAALETPASTYVALTVVVAPEAATPLRGDRLRAAGSALALGLLASLAAGFACDSIATALRRRQHQEEPSGVQPPTQQLGRFVGLPPPVPRPGPEPGVGGDRPPRTSQPAGR